MTLLRSVTIFIILAIFTSTIADAQLRRLRDRAKERAEDRLEQKAEQAVDRQVDKAIDGLWDESGDMFVGMLESSLPDSKTTVDEEAGVVKREGQDDLMLDDNASGPVHAEYVSYSMVSIMNLPGQLQALMSRFGNARVDEVYLHADRKYSGNDESGTTLDAANVSYSFYDHERREYWQMDFEETFESAARAMEQANEQIEAQADAAPPSGEQPSYEMDVTVSSREGERGIKRGLDARQFIVIVEVVAKDPEQAEQNGRMYMVSDIWTATEFAGSETLAAFDRKLGEGVLESLQGEDFNDNLNVSFFNDPRLKEAMEEAAEAFELVEGTPIETTTYFVMGPEDSRLDLDAVLNPDPEAEADVRSFPGTTSEEPVQSQATLFSTKTFMANLSTEPFDVGLLGDRGYTQIESPIKQVLDSSGE